MGAGFYTLAAAGAGGRGEPNVNDWAVFFYAAAKSWQVLTQALMNYALMRA